MRSTTPIDGSNLRNPSSGIHIKESHKGLLHEKLGVPQGNKIPASKLSIKPGDNASTRKQKTFAKNAKTWSH